MIRTQKWVLMAKQGLRKICILKDQFGLKLGRGTKREGEGEEKRKRKKKKRRRGRRRAKPKVWMLGFWVWKLTLIMNPMRLSMKFHAIGWLLVIPKPRVC